MSANSSKAQNCCKAVSLVIDSGPLLKGIPLAHLAEKFFTIPEVISELRNKQTRESLALLSFDLQIRTPSAEALKEVIAFAKKTGDFASLSATDLRVLALTYMLEVEANGVKHIRKEPIQARTAVCQKSDREVRAGCGAPDGQAENGIGISADTEDKAQMIVSNFHDQELEVSCRAPEETAQEQQAVLSDADDRNSDDGGPDVTGDDDEKGWITPDNVSRFKQQSYGHAIHARNRRKRRDPMEVACTTTDYAMQNFLLQMHLNLLSVDGMQIRRIKNWVLRCHACFKVTKDMEKKFCPSCGNTTLIRTSTSTDENGNITYYLKRNFQYNLRGTMYPIPNPHGGRKSSDIILREDQREYVKALKAQRKDKPIDIFDPDYVPKMLNGTRAVNAEPIIGYGKRNPNERQRCKGRRKH